MKKVLNIGAKHFHLTAGRQASTALQNPDGFHQKRIVTESLWCWLPAATKLAPKSHNTGRMECMTGRCILAEKIGHFLCRTALADSAVQA